MFIELEQYGPEGHNVKMNYKSVLRIEIRSDARLVFYKIYKYNRYDEWWSQSFSDIIYRNDSMFDMEIFSSQISSAYYHNAIREKFVKKEDMKTMTNKLQTIIDKMRHGVESNCVRWIGKQIHREWKDLLPYVSTILDE